MLNEISSAHSGLFFAVNFVFGFCHIGELTFFSVLRADSGCFYSSVPTKTRRFLLLAISLLFNIILLVSDELSRWIIVASISRVTRHFQWHFRFFPLVRVLAASISVNSRFSHWLKISRNKTKFSSPISNRNKKKILWPTRSFHRNDFSFCSRYFTVQLQWQHIFINDMCVDDSTFSFFNEIEKASTFIWRHLMWIKHVTSDVRHLIVCMSVSVLFTE